MKPSQIFGRLTAIAFVESRGKSRNAYWRFRCECGKEIVTAATNVKSGASQSCGCLRREMKRAALTVHGQSDGRERLYRIWHAMRVRCLTPTAANYHYYGGHCHSAGLGRVRRVQGVGLGERLCGKSFLGPQGQRSKLHARQLPLGNGEGTGEQQTKHASSGVRVVLSSPIGQAARVAAFFRLLNRVAL